MIVAMIGPSCSGKSYYLRLLRENMGFEIPIGITTRPKRNNDSNSSLKHISENEFKSLKEANKICLIDGAFGHAYAYPVPLSLTDSNIAIEIRRNNISELRNMGGYLIKILPCSIQIGLEKIYSERSGSVVDRISELQSEFGLMDETGFDAVFDNCFDQASAVRFLNIINSLTAVR